MGRYLKLGDIPSKRHVQFRQPGGSLYHEEVFGQRGFSGPYSILYHQNAPTRILSSRPMGPLKRRALPFDELRHRHLRTGQLPRTGDALSGRVPLMMNDDVCILYCKPTERMTQLYKNSDGDDLLYVHAGSGTLDSMFGSIAFRPGDYLVVPRGTIYRLEYVPEELELLVIESSSGIEPPRRYRNEYGQLLEHSPYCERDIRVPQAPDVRSSSEPVEVLIRARNHLTACMYDYHPFDVAGWDGCVYPWVLSIHDFAPITGMLHQPPPVHQTFEAHNFVVCSFCPRMLDTHPEAIPIPYNHSNLESDEVLFYCNDKFGSRKGIEVGSITLHPSGLAHGPQPGAVEASLGKTRTEELAVMVDTFRPLSICEGALPIDQPDYPMSWRA